MIGWNMMQNKTFDFAGSNLENKITFENKCVFYKKLEMIEIILTFTIS